MVGGTGGQARCCRILTGAAVTDATYYCFVSVIGSLLNPAPFPTPTIRIGLGDVCTVPEYVNGAWLASAIVSENAPLSDVPETESVNDWPL